MKRNLILCILAALLALTACQPATAKPVEGAARDAVLAYAEPAADNLFNGINANDYVAFARDFDTKMAAAMDEKAFQDLQTAIIGKIGKYVSRQVSSVEESGKYITVVYTAVFEQDDPVTVRLVFNSDEDNKISGLWFDSAKMRQ